MSHPLSIITYVRGLHPLTNQPLPYHWSLFIHTAPSSTRTTGLEYQLRGMPGAFHYDGPDKIDLHQTLATKKAELDIGLVPADKLDALHELLMAITIETSESSGWNCQNWTLDAVERLRAEAWVEKVYSREVIRNWLKES